MNMEPTCGYVDECDQRPLPPGAAISSTNSSRNDENSDNMESWSSLPPCSHISRVWLFAKQYPTPLKAELVFCILYALLFGQIKYITSVTERPIPYMVTTNSHDVIINLSLNHEYVTPEKETIPDFLLILIALVLPLITMIFTGITLGVCSTCNNTTSSKPYPWWLDLHSSICTFLIAFGSTAFFTNFFKYYVGYLRPNFYTMCNYDSATMTCNNNDDIKREIEARKSFPSGHASASFCGMLCLGLYLAGKVGLNHHISASNSINNNTTTLSTTNQHQPPWKKFVFLMALGGPLFLSTFVAASRVHDNWHHPADVVAGSLVGASCAVVAYHLWYVLWVIL